MQFQICCCREYIFFTFDESKRFQALWVETEKWIGKNIFLLETIRTKNSFNSSGHKNTDIVSWKESDRPLIEKLNHSSWNMLFLNLTAYLIDDVILQGEVRLTQVNTLSVFVSSSSGSCQSTSSLLKHVQM